MMRHITVFLLACTLLAGAAVADNSVTTQTQATAKPDATVKFSGGSVAAGIGYVWGKGDLAYHGKKYAFELSGLSIVDIGVAHIVANGAVYNLKDVSEFSGNYTAVTVGVTIAGGGSAAVLRNERGVVIKLISTTRGLRFNLSANGVGIKLRS